MPENTQADSDQHKIDKKKAEILDPGMKRIFTLGIVVLFLLLIFTFAQASGRLPFFTQNFLSLLVLVAIAIQAYIYRRQWEVMERQGNEIERQSKQAREHAIHTLRAYVNIRVVAPDFPKQVLMEIVNFGQTPAHNVQFAHTIAVKPFQETPEATPESIDWVIPGVPLAPTMSIEKPLPLGKISEADMAKLHDPQYRLFIWGVIRYEDVFYKTRYTRFSAFHIPQTKRLGTCPRGNDAN